MANARLRAPSVHCWKSLSYGAGRGTPPGSARNPKRSRLDPGTPPDSARSAPHVRLEANPLGRGVRAPPPFGQRNHGPASATLQTVAGDNTTHSASWSAVVSLKKQTQEPPRSRLCSSSEPSRRAQCARPPPKSFARCSPAPIPVNNESSRPPLGPTHALRERPRPLSLCLI